MHKRSTVNVAGTSCFMLMIMLMTMLYINTLKHRKKKVNVSLKIVWKAMILSNFGLLLLLPSLIWNNALQEYHFPFVILYTTLSQLLVYTGIRYSFACSLDRCVFILVVCNCSKLWSIVVIVLSYYCKIFSNDLYNVVYDHLFMSS